MMDMNDDQKIKDMLLQSLIEKMEDIMGDDRMAPKKAMSVEVAAPDKAHLADGLDKAQEVIAHAPVPEMGGKPGEDADAEDGKSDAERLAELMGDEDDEDEKC